MQNDEVGIPYSLAPNFHDRITLSFLREIDRVEASGPYEKFRRAYLKEHLLSKYNDGSSDGAEERKSAAIRKWQQMELRNSRTNTRFHAAIPAYFAVKGGVLSSDRILLVARKYVCRVLGEAPDLEVLYGTFTNGASTSFQRGNLAAKFMAEADVTERCYPVFSSILETCDTWKLLRGPLVPRVVVGGSLFTVPKNSEIDRCAIKEPGLNMFCQKGVGEFLHKRLRNHARINTHDQTRNQRLAREGSITGKLATLDLSSASDLISIELVRALLPDAWFDLLDSIRSTSVVVEGHVQELNMFSSMGNGFTFELETLIFASLAHAVAFCTGSKGSISVYGDDIIVPSSIAGLLVKVLQYYGLRVNPQKSYWTGPFRESCGRHWYAGRSVTPFYVKEPISSVTRLIHFLNQLRNWLTCQEMLICDPDHYTWWLRWSKYVPSAFYGGRDTSRIDALVTPHKPRKLLVKSTKRVRNRSETGAYLHWLRSTDGRKELSEPVITSMVVVERKGYVTRRSNVLGTSVIAMFPQEMWGVP